MKNAPALALLPLCIGLVCCGDESDDMMGSPDMGVTDMGTSAPSPEYYSGTLSSGLGSATNQADCALCHSNDGTDLGYSGVSMKDIAYRTAFKNGGAPTLLAASNVCITGWMGGPALTETSPEWLSLEAYFQSISDSTVTTPNTFMPEVLADEAAYEVAYATGDAAAGASKYTTNCGGCHDSATVVNAVPSYPKTTLAAYSIGRIAQKVRTSGPPPSGSMDASDTTPGPMPFFTFADLTQQDLADIIAHLKE